MPPTSPQSALYGPSPLLAFLATPEGVKVAAPLINVSEAVFMRFPKSSCFLAGMALMALITNRTRTAEPTEAP